MTPINLKGKVFNRLTVLWYDLNSKGKGHAYWYCKCICGNRVYIRASHLKTKSVQSCGCLSREKASKRLTEYVKSNKYKGPGNHQWKGDKAKVAAIHNWLSRHFKKEKCSKCGTKKTLDWALKINYNYSHNRKHFIVLCRSHHLEYDYKNNIR